MIESLIEDHLEEQCSRPRLSCPPVAAHGDGLVQAEALVRTRAA